MYEVPLDLDSALLCLADLFERCRGEVDASGSLHFFSSATNISFPLAYFIFYFLFYLGKKETYAARTQIHNLGGDIVIATGLLCTDHLATSGAFLEFSGGECDDVVAFGIVGAARAKAWFVIRSVAVVGVFWVRVFSVEVFRVFSEEEGSGEG